MRRLSALLVLALIACSPTAPPRVAPPAAPAFAPSGTARRVVLLSFDGLGADALARRSGLPAFERLAREGASARVIPVNPTATAPTHVTILTGADPQRTGIVSNRFHVPGTPEEVTTRGMDIDSEVETLVEAARRQGKRVGAVSFPTIDNHSARHGADFGLGWGNPLTHGRLVSLTRTDFRREWVPPTWTERPQRRQSFSPIMRARLEWSVPKRILQDVDLVAYDTTDDRTENYDTLLIEAGEQEIAPDDRGWFAVSRTAVDGLYGSWSKVLSRTPSLDVTIYWGPIVRNDAWPESFRALLDREAGFWPGAPEEEVAIDPATYTEQLERLAAFMTHVQTLAIERMPFDLLLLYRSEIDGSSHQYLGRPEGEPVIRTAFGLADRAVAAAADALDTTDALLVMGDHGLAVVEREVRLNTLLAEKGFAPRWRAFTAGNLAHLYRFDEPDDTDALLAMLTATGYFERVEKRGLNAHRNSGDLVAWGWPNIAFSAMDAQPSVIAVTHGQHGALNTHRELHPAFFAYGAGVQPGPLGEIAQTRIARYVAGLLGIEPPMGAE
jgi:hypothetical protein